jgi:hypothetical protein
LDVGLDDAWRHWLSGDSLEQARLWGINILWWGRIGRLLEFAAALTIIAEIIGPERLRAFGRSLRTRVTARRALGLAWATLLWAWVWIYEQVIHDEDVTETRERAGKYRSTAKLHIVVSILLVFPTAYLLWRWGGWGATFWTVLVAPAVAIPATVVLVLGWTLPGIALEWLLVRPVARILDREALDKWIKSGSALMLLVGFHFDLLSS